MPRIGPRLLPYLIAPVLAVVMVFAVPALRATAPLARPAQWTIASLGAGAARAASHRGQSSSDLHRWLDEARSLWQQFHGAKPGAQHAMTRALTLAALIPVLAIVAGICAILSLIFQLWYRPGWFRGAAIAGLASSAYVIAASWWLTHMMRTGLAEVIASFQQRWGGLIAALGGHNLTAALSTPLGLVPQAGLYVLFLAFIAMLVLPGRRAIG